VSVFFATAWPIEPPWRRPLPGRRAVGILIIGIAKQVLLEPAKKLSGLIALNN
jgi:hypothetical protein